MRALLWLLTLAALAVGLSLAARYNDGYVLFVLPPWRAEVSLNLLLVIQVVGFLLLYLILRGVINTLSLPDKVREFRARRARNKAESALADAMWLLQEGRYGRALASAERAYDAGHRAGLAALVAQRAAHAMRDDYRETVWRERAAHHDAEVHAARLMTEAELALEARDFGAARDALNRLAASEGRHLAALRLSWRAEQGLGNWQEVLRLTKQLEKYKAISAEQAAPIRSRAHRETIAQMGDPAQLVRYWNAMPAADRLEPRLAQQAVRTLASTGGCAEAANLIEDFLDERWDSAVVSVYADCEGGDTLARIAHAEKWLLSHPRDEQLLLALGRLCRQQKLWGKAQSYLEASLSVRPTRGAHIELAQLLESLERGDEANRHFRAAAVL
ncbi:MAG: heme biosynthesis HemY N-terminal domain-containing protein [Rhodocyclaceae bacterium]|nr:heme biosynthesis HemY N-terminal domain-containing protein [Rhodocyclaceae bacterium]